MGHIAKCHMYDPAVTIYYVSLWLPGNLTLFVKTVPEMLVIYGLNRMHISSLPAFCTNNETCVGFMILHHN